MDFLKCLKCAMIPQRVILSFMGFLAVAVSHTMRICLSIAITEMVIPINSTKQTIDSSICADHSPSPGNKIAIHQIDLNDGLRYNWSQEQQGWIFSSFYIGYLLAHLPAGILAEKFCGKWTVALSILVEAVCSAVTPHAVAFGGFNAFIVIRTVMGLFGGVVFPSIAVLLAAWIPEKERAKLGSLAFSGSQVGSLSAFYFSGLILSHYQWPIVFYFWSGVAIIWFILFALFCSSDPASHPLITKKETEYLNTEMGQLKRQTGLPLTPWKKILTSSPVIALLIAQFGNDCLWSILAVYLPKYMKEILGFSVQEAGLYSSLPYLLLWIVSILSGFLCDYLINRRFLTIVQARKLFGALSGFFPALFLVAASYFGCNRTLVVLSFIMAMGFLGNYFPGLRVNALDLSPNYAASIISIVNGAGSLTGVLVPPFVGFLTNDSTIEQWRTVFWITFIVAMVRVVIFSIWASGEVQPWNNPIENEPATTYVLTAGVKHPTEYSFK